MYSVSPKNDTIVGDTKMEHDGQVSDPLELLFFDTFSHESNEEINLDLVQFPKPVYIGEIRIIPLGARVQADFPGGVRLGATNPSQFKIEFFINDLSKPGASTFQHLGVVDYNQNGHIHFECSRDQLISTDGLVLRGWYTTITLAVYGILTKTTSPEPVRPDMSTVEWLQQHQQVEVVTNRVYGPTEAVSTHYGSYPVQEGAIIEQDPVYNRTIPVTRQPPYPWPQANTMQYEQRTPPEQYDRQKEMYEQDNWERREDNQHWEQRKERHQDNYRYDRRRSDDRSPEYDEHVSADYVPTSRTAGGPDYYGKRTRNWAGNEWPSTNQACEGVVTVPITTTQKRPHTPPIPTVHKECSPSQTAQFESMSPGDVESISEGDIPETEGLDDNVKSPPTPPCAEVENPQAPSPRQTFEPILSDDEITDDQFQDIEYDFSEFTEDPLKSFNPYTNEIPQLTHFADPSMPPCAWSFSKPFDVTIQDGQELLKIVDSIKNLKEEKEEWVEAASQATSILLKSLPRLPPPKRDDLMKRLNEWVAFGLNFEEAFTQPRPAMKLRHIKVGIKLVETISECGEEYTKQMILSSDAQIGLLSLFHQEYMALVIKLMILRALDATLRYKSSVELFIGKGRANGYESLWEMIQNTNHARIKFAISSLLRKLNLFDLLVKLNSYCDKLKIEMDSIKSDGGEITEKFKFDEEFLTLALEEVYRIFVNAPLLLSQPKRFLPVTSQFEINAADFPDPYPAMYTYFRFTGLLKNFLVLLNLSSHSVIMPINNLLAEFLEAEGGLKFLASSRETNDIISLMLGSSGKHNKSNRRVNPTLGLHMAYRLRALSYLDQLSSLSRSANDPDDAQSLEVLQGLFNLTLSNIGNFGKSSVVHAIALNDNIEILLNILKRKSNKKRSASRGYVCDLLYLSVKFSSDVPFLQKYSRELTELVSGDFVEMQEIQNWLVPFKNNCCDVSSACDILKNCVSSCTSLPSEMVCAVKLLKYLCIPKGSKDVCFTLEEGECVELKYKYNLLQTYSLDGLSSLVAILQKLTARFEQPYLYSSRLTGRHGLMLIAFILPAVQLIRRILSLIIKARNTDFKDLSVVPVLLQTYALMQAIPVNAQAHSDSLRVCREIVDTLLAYTQPISSEDCTENEALNKSLWTLMIMEVLKFTCEIPLNFVTGLLVLSELLPLPLPLQSQTPLSETVKTTLANSRRLWSAHLHSLHSLLETMIVTMSTSNCHPLLQILRRVCVQLADLAAPTALMVVRTLVDSIIPLLDTAKIDSTLPRLLNFLARLVTHGSVKAAFLFLITSNDKYKGLISNMTDIFRSSADKVEKEQSQECLASIFLSVIDTEICLVPLSSSSTDIYLSHALPSKNLLVVICDSLLDHLLLDVPFTTCLTAMRTFILLVEHDFGFYHVKTTFEKRPSAIHDLFARIEKQWSKENHNLLATLSATLDFLRALACLEGVEYSLRKLRFSLPELLHLIQWGPGYPLQTIESKLKGMTEEDETMEPLLENVSSFLKILTDEVVQPCPPKEISEPSLPTSQPLLAQFDLRSICLVGQEISKERLTATYWLAPPNPEEQGAESDQVLVDLVEFAKNELNGLDLSEAISGLIHRKSDSNAERTTEEKKAKVTDETTNNSYVPSRGRNLRAPCAVGRGDAFRSRPPNTSRPPSLHVDDFVALETCGGPVTHGRPAVLVTNEKVGRARGRGRSFGIDRGSRYFGGHPATYHRESIETVWDRGIYGGADVMAAIDPISNGRFGRMGLPMGMGAWAGVESRVPHPTDRGHLLPNFFQR